MNSNFRMYDGTFRPIYEDDVPCYATRPGDLPQQMTNFGKSWVDDSATRLAAFFKSKGVWCRFTLEELREFYVAQGWNPDGMLYGLAVPWYWFSDEPGEESIWHEPSDIYLVNDMGNWLITDRFIERCANIPKLEVLPDVQPPRHDLPSKSGARKPDPPSASDSTPPHA